MDARNNENVTNNVALAKKKVITVLNKYFNYLCDLNNGAEYKNPRFENKSLDEIITTLQVSVNSYKDSDETKNQANQADLSAFESVLANAYSLLKTVELENNKSQSSIISDSVNAKSSSVYVASPVKSSVTLNAVALTAVILLAIGASATLVAICMPGRMPEAMSAFVDILESLKEILVPTASVVVGLSTLGVFYESAQIHKKNNVLFAVDFNTLEYEPTSKSQLQ